MPAPYLGRCLCDTVQYRLNGEPLTVYACHCTDCQKRSGSAFGLSMWVRRADIVVAKGEAATLEVTGVDGKPRHHRTCAKCGTRLWSERPDRLEIAVLRPGTLEDTKWLRPVAHLWTRSAQPWFTFPRGVTRFETQPDDLKELVVLWQQRGNQ